MHRLAKMKDKLIEEAQSRMEAMDGGSIEQMSQIIDMIKDLSEAEKACLEAEYYDSVVEAMEDGNYGSRGGYRASEGYRGDGYSGRDGYDRMGYRNAQGQYAKKPRRMRRSGYSDESIENVRMLMEEADPARKKQLKADLQELMSEM